MFHKTRIEALINQAIWSTLGAVIKHEKLFPLQDSTFVFSDTAQSLGVMGEMGFYKGGALPVSYNTDFNMQTDESFSRIFFHGIAAPLVMKSKE
eukprot:4612443-Ditylum_brightwellii.AAC.1